jgi:hypothetical protein
LIKAGATRQRRSACPRYAAGRGRGTLPCVTDSVNGRRVAPALALLLTGFAVLFVLLAAATPCLASLPTSHSSSQALGSNAWRWAMRAVNITLLALWVIFVILLVVQAALTCTSLP